MEEDRNLEDFIRKSIKEVGLENPSKDFTDNVLNIIENKAPAPTNLVFKPLLSKTTWFVILSAVAAIFIYLIFGNPNLESTWISVSQWNHLVSFNLLGELPQPAVSKTFVYACLIITGFVWIQVLMLKHHFNKVRWLS